MKLFVATHNKHKLSEIAQILPDFEIVADNPEGIVEDAPDFAGNALIKVRAISARHPGQWCMADDSGLEVKALSGAPGVRSARYAGKDGDTAANNALLLENMAGVAERSANFTCVIALVSPDGEEHIREGKVFGTIAESPSGCEGFGYDPLFIPEGCTKSFAELSSDEKNAMSHRGRALEGVKELLAANGRDGASRKPSGGIGAYLRLTRAVNIPTVPGDILVGAAAALAANGSFSVSRTLIASLASVFFYLFGIVDNDIAGAARNTSRPIPDGEISIHSARMVRALFWALAIVSGRYLGASVEWWIAASVLLVSIVAYNRTKISALMGLCRALNVLMGALAVIPSGAGGFRLFCMAGLPAAVWLAYVTLLTRYAKREDGNPRIRSFVGVLIGGIVYLQIFALLVFALFVSDPAISRLLVGGGVLLIALRLFRRIMPTVDPS